MPLDSRIRSARPTRARMPGGQDARDRAWGRDPVAHERARLNGVDPAHRRAEPDRRPQDHPERRGATLALRCGRSVTDTTLTALGQRSRTVTIGEGTGAVLCRLRPYHR